MKRKFRSREFAEEMRSLMEEVRATHPFAKMSEEEISRKLRETREIVAAERNERRIKSSQTDQ